MRSGEIPPQKCSEVQSSGYAAEASNGGIAQLVERVVRNDEARGSNPLTSKMPQRYRSEISGRILSFGRARE